MPSTQTPPKVALIAGITGQDGSYLAESLLEKSCIVNGIKRRASSFKCCMKLASSTRHTSAKSS